MDKVQKEEEEKEEKEEKIMLVSHTIVRALQS
jgi:hypothetical protein